MRAKTPEPEPVEPLTDREKDVIRLLGQGISNKEIGATLFITERTARTYVSNILGKLGLASARRPRCTRSSTSSRSRPRAERPPTTTSASPRSFAIRSGARPTRPGARRERIVGPGLDRTSRPGLGGLPTPGSPELRLRSRPAAGFAVEKRRAHRRCPASRPAQRSDRPSRGPRPGSPGPPPRVEPGRPARPGVRIPWGHATRAPPS